MSHLILTVIFPSIRFPLSLEEEMEDGKSGRLCIYPKSHSLKLNSTKCRFQSPSYLHHTCSMLSHQEGFQKPGLNFLQTRMLQGLWATCCKYLKD